MSTAHTDRSPDRTSRFQPPSVGSKHLPPWICRGPQAIGLLLSLAGILGPAAALTGGLILSRLCPLPDYGRKLSSLLLRGAVVLLGFCMDLPTLWRVGARHLPATGLCLAIALVLGHGLGRRLKMDPRVSGLITAGTAICGGSAIAAVAAAVGATEGAVTVAMGTVFLLNAAGLYLFPILGELAQLTPEQFGVWAGMAIHDLSSVVGAATVFGGGALEVATPVKLARTLWILPLTALAGYFARADRTADGPRPRVPLFLLLFLAASVTRTWVPELEPLAPRISAVATAGLTAALFLIGASLRAGALREVGWRPLALGIALWTILAALGFVLAGPLAAHSPLVPVG